MKKINVHRYENELWGRSHLPFFKKFDEYLSKYFELNVINYNKDGNTFSGKINLIGQFNQFGNTPSISDVDYIIEHSETGEVKVISFTEYFNHYICHISKSEFTSKVLLSHFNWYNLYYWMKRENSVINISKIKPYIFLPFAEFDIDYYRNYRKENIDNLNEKMFWLGSGVDSYRKMIRLIENDGFLQPINSTSHSEYLSKLSRSKVGISYYLDLDKYTTPFDHPGEFCYRDIEYMLCGVPFIRIEFKDQLHDQLLPNFHYISIPREVAYVVYDKHGDRGIADLYIKKYNEIKDDYDFLKYISENQIEWSNRNLLGQNKEKLTFELLELNKWL